MDGCAGCMEDSKGSSEGISLDVFETKAGEHAWHVPHAFKVPCGNVKRKKKKITILLVFTEHREKKNKRENDRSESEPDGESEDENV